MASIRLVALAALLLPLLNETAALMWIPPGPVDKLETVDSCAGQTVHIPWTYNKSVDEEFLSINWSLNSPADGDDKLLATWSDTFNATDPRAGFVGNAGISLEGITVLDAGTVTMKLTCTINETSTNNATLVTRNNETRIAVLRVLGPPVVKENKLSLSLDLASYQTSTGLYQATLRCGSFSQRGCPPAHPLLETPDGRSVRINDYDGDEFIYPVNLSSLKQGKHRCVLNLTQCLNSTVNAKSP